MHMIIDFSINHLAILNDQIYLFANLTCLQKAGPNCCYKFGAGVRFFGYVVKV